MILDGSESKRNGRNARDDAGRQWRSEIAIKESSRRPEWIKAKAPAGKNYEEVLELVRRLHLHTVCQSARCPNIGECWAERTATFMILGRTCTRNCKFCAVESGATEPADPSEAERVALAAQALKLRHAVITSVTRDDLPDGGASIFAASIRAIREKVLGCTVEVLVPDFRGSKEALETVMEAGPDVLNHNLETVARLYPRVRPGAVYVRSLELLRLAKEIAPKTTTKSGLMVGIGETTDEVLQAMQDLRHTGCDILTIGQYLRPSLSHLPIERYYAPSEFEMLRTEGMRMGFAHVESGPLVRSSYHAARQVFKKAVTGYEENA